jgi:hypothetical protein
MNFEYLNWVFQCLPAGPVTAAKPILASELIVEVPDALKDPEDPERDVPTPRVELAPVE